PEDDKPAPARIVLLSDGYSNQGRDPAEAGQLARDAGIPVSTIAFGTNRGTVTVEGTPIPVPADRQTLHSLATTTGGSFHTATSAAELRTVYEDIGSQIGYMNAERDISWRFLVTG